MLTFRPDVIPYPAQQFLADLSGMMMTEDFRWAVWHAAGTAASAEIAISLARTATGIAFKHESKLPRFPGAILRNMPVGNLGEGHPVPLLIGRDESGVIILGVLSDARP